ncbi:MAG: hypothetical protein LIO79_08795 [Rikenellaceae bacterium]|nr:hypothetical protein [Rikenellaceae bacterium]
MVDYKFILAEASATLSTLRGQTIDAVSINKPETLESAVQLSKIISKLSPFVANILEYRVVDFLNSKNDGQQGVWKRQDPGFPDVIYDSSKITPNPGIEIKTWFPLATEITGRFKESITIFSPDHINIAIIAWIPEFVIFGKPLILDTLVISGKSVAEARDSHYHKPPEYIVLEPEDTSKRTSNLRQTNTTGYVFQKDRSSYEEAQMWVDRWPEEWLTYSPDVDYQKILKDLKSRFEYKTDTNYGKMDRIQHQALEEFKQRILDTEYMGCTIQQWRILLKRGGEGLRGKLEPILECVREDSL